MKIRQIKLAIRSVDETAAETKEVLKKLDRGERVPRHEGLYFESLETMRKVLSEERIRVLKTIRKSHPSSIYVLAKVLKRDFKNVSDDVHYLSEMGLIDLKKAKTGRTRVTPLVNYEKILLEIPV